jgi:hemerythrin superfamily protein
MPTKNDAVKMLKADHKKVKALFDEFEDTEDVQERQRIAQTAIQELTIHAELEEEIFYPTVRQAMDEDETEIMNEAEEEHHVAKLLIEELKGMDPSDDKFAAKFTVLAENVRHHIKEEEGEMLPKAQKTDVDMQELGQQMMTRKEELAGQANEQAAAPTSSRKRNAA